MGEEGCRGHKGGKCKNKHHVLLVSQKCQETLQRNQINACHGGNAVTVCHSHFVTNKYFLPFLGRLYRSPPGQTCSGESPLMPHLGGGAFWRQERIFLVPALVTPSSQRILLTRDPATAHQMTEPIVHTPDFGRPHDRFGQCGTPE